MRGRYDYPGPTIGLLALAAIYIAGAIVGFVCLLT